MDLQEYILNEECLLLELTSLSIKQELTTLDKISVIKWETRKIKMKLKNILMQKINYPFKNERMKVCQKCVTVK